MGGRGRADRPRSGHRASPRRGRSRGRCGDQEVVPPRSPRGAGRAAVGVDHALDVDVVVPLQYGRGVPGHRVEVDAERPPRREGPGLVPEGPMPRPSTTLNRSRGDEAVGSPPAPRTFRSARSRPHPPGRQSAKTPGSPSNGVGRAKRSSRASGRVTGEICGPLPRKSASYWKAARRRSTDHARVPTLRIVPSTSRRTIILSTDRPRPTPPRGARKPASGPAGCSPG